MRKILAFTVAILLASFMHAQYAVGDYYELDGIPSIVIYVDQTGSHGLVMSYPAVCDEEQINALLKKNSMPKSLADLYLSGGIAYLQDQKGEKTVEKDIVATVYTQMGPDGKENARIVRDYCVAQGIAIEQYFANQAWAEHLGNGWYIPGDNELEHIGRFFLQGAPAKSKYSSLFKHLKNIREKYINENAFFVPFSPYSSSRDQDHHFSHRMMLCYKGTGKDCQLAIHNGDAVFKLKGLLESGYYYVAKNSLRPFENQDGNWILGGLIAKKRQLIILENLIGFGLPSGSFFEGSNGGVVAIHEF